MNEAMIKTIWAFIENYDKSKKVSYLISAYSILAAAGERGELPNFKINVWLARDGGTTIRWVSRELTNEELADFAANAISTLLQHQEYLLHGRSASLAIIETMKHNLIKILTAIGAVINPFELYTAELTDSEVREE